MDLFRHRAARLQKGELCAVDSTSRSAYGNTLTDIKWGMNKDKLPLEQTMETVVYTLDSHMPVYYRAFPGNIPDSRSVETILTDIRHAGFPHVILITDRGYESLQNLKRYILAGLDDDVTTKRNYNYFEIDYNECDRTIRSFTLNEEKVAAAQRTSGFFAIMTHKLDMDAITVLDNYGLRDEQEKYFQQMKGQMGFDKQRCWSEEGKTGRLFVLFTALIISSYIRHIWKTTNLKDTFGSTHEMLDEMRSIRCIGHKEKARFITPFVGSQLDICKAFGFDVPQGCAPRYMSKKKAEKKRGRPKKQHPIKLES